MSGPAEEIREAVRRFAAERLAPNAARWDREKTFPKEALKGLAEMGLYGVAIPEEWGGAGLDYTSLAVACEEIAAGDCSTATIVSVNNLVAGILAGYGNKKQKEEFLKPLAQGKLLAAFALTEPQVGSDASAITTRAEKQGSHYVLNGVKQFITSGKNADVAVVFAVTQKQAGKRGISAFLVPTSTPGYKVARIEDKTGQRASDTAQIVFELQGPADPLLAQKASVTASRSPTWSRAASMSPRRRPAWRARHWRRRSPGAERKRIDKLLIGHQAVNFRLADMATQVEAARRLYLHAARLRDAGKPCLKEASMAKLFASEMAEGVCSDAIQIHGGYGYVSDFPVERLWRDVRVTKIYEGANDIQRLVIGRALEEG
jgi:alkylation response protein AidB-like acyl-CoA dehydrogenase